MKESENPLRPCRECGITGDCYKLYKGERVIYSALCRSCTRKNVKNRTYPICKRCGADKENNYIRHCKECTSQEYYENNIIIKYEDLVTIKKWVRKQEIRNWMTDLHGINELLNIYELIKRNDEDFETFTPGKQLQRMWTNVYKLWLLIKDLDDKLLRIVRIDKKTLKIENIIEMERTSITDEDLDFFFKNLNRFEFKGREYSLEKEYKDCINGVSNVSCVRCRKIIQQLRRGLTQLKTRTVKDGGKVWDRDGKK